MKNTALIWLTLVWLILPATSFSEPALPAGLSDEPTVETESPTSEPKWANKIVSLSGFIEGRYGLRLTDDSHQKDTTLAETRAQVQADAETLWAAFRVTSDFVYDGVEEDHDINLNKGKGWIDLREANGLFRPVPNVDAKIGRQILTWGTGDLVFINDLFPKDWNSFFIGRDEEYLKAPSDAGKISFFNPLINLDAVYVPQFDGDRFIDGTRISYYDAATNQIVGRNKPVQVDGPDDAFEDDELSLRLHRLFGGYETSLYYYNGYWKSPAGMNSSGQSLFPELEVTGASLRGPFASGLAHTEVGYYNSQEDTGGSNAQIRNSEWRFLAGYEQELMLELTGSVQYYLERMDDYAAYKSSLPRGAKKKDQNRHLFTTRLTKSLMQQNLILSGFVFYSPNDKDVYIRPKATYKLTDQWQMETGGNLFFGKKTTFFGQFEDTTNWYASARYSF